MPDGQIPTVDWSKAVPISAPPQVDWRKAKPVDSPSLWQRATTPLVSGPTILKGIDYASGIRLGAGDRVTEQAIAEGSPTKAAIDSFLSGTGKSVVDLASSFTSPVSLGLMAASGGESALSKAVPAVSKLLKVPQLASLLGFGAQGAKQAVQSGATPSDAIHAAKHGLHLTDTPPKASADQIESMLFGAATVAGSAAGTGAFTKDSVRGVLRKKLGLNDDLASQVPEKIAQKNQIELKEQADLARVRDEGTKAQREAQSRTAQTVTAVEQHLEQQLQSMQGQTSARITDLTQQADRTTQEAQAKLPDLEQKKLQAGGKNPCGHNAILASAES